jgi:hypothetical protein
MDKVRSTRIAILGATPIGSFLSAGLSDSVTLRRSVGGLFAVRPGLYHALHECAICCWGNTFFHTFSFYGKKTY